MDQADVGYDHAAVDGLAHVVDGEGTDRGGGERIAEQSSRPNLEFHFTILNDPLVNAFALPGGYVYVTRGMLAHMNSESELAAVLGHEIAHVTEKHAERSMNRGKIMKGLSTVAAIATGTTAAYDLSNMFGGVLLKGYSRSFELEADSSRGLAIMCAIRSIDGLQIRSGESPAALCGSGDPRSKRGRSEFQRAPDWNAKNRVPGLTI